MEVTVEFFGVARLRMGRSSVTVRLSPTGTTVADVFSGLVQKYPEFGDCLSEGRLISSLSANLNGDFFVAGCDMTVAHGDSLLIMSTDAGG